MALQLVDPPPIAGQASYEDGLRIACRAAGIGVWHWDQLSGEMSYTALAREICGFPATGAVTYEMAKSVTHPADFPRTSAQARRALDPAIRDNSEFRYRILRADTGEERWVKAYGEAQFAIVDGQERAVSFVGSLQDITDEVAQGHALAESEARLRLAVQAGELAVWEVDVATDTVIGSPELNRLYGFPEDSSPTLDELRSRYAPGEHERLQSRAEQILAVGGTHLEFDIKHIWPDGTVKWLLMRAEVGLNRNGDGARVIGVVADITEAKLRQERLATLAKELRHRLLNTISVISAIAARSWPEGFVEERKRFQNRLFAIGKAHDLMFSGAERSEPATLSQLLLDVTEPYRSGADNPFIFEGPDIAVDEHLRNLAMAFHELATNAVKYGALSVEEGRIYVRWSEEFGGGLRIIWQEVGGPHVLPPSKVGLGTNLLANILFPPPHAASLTYDHGGVCYEILLRFADR